MVGTIRHPEAYKYLYRVRPQHKKVACEGGTLSSGSV
jgi:hypothetical protein